MTFQISETTLSPEVGNLLESFLGSKIAREGVLPNRKKFDFFLFLNDYKVIIELKIGGFEKLPYAISQAESYKEKVGADGVIAIVYPDEARRVVTRPEEVRDIASDLQATVMVLTPFLKDYYPHISLVELATRLKAAIAEPKLAPSVDLVVDTLRNAVQGISLEIRRSIGIDHPIIKQTVGSLALFDILVEDVEDTKVKASKEATKDIVVDLAAYILVNQILLRHILAKSLNLSRGIEPVSSPAELNSYFKDVTDIDYKAVYCIDIASNIPAVATNEVNVCILAIRAIQPENLSHDLLGRIFHEFLPQETRKQLGTFYTRPQAAELLAGLSINRGNESVLDPSCGSGTLLVAAYRRKRYLDKARSHKKMIEEEITGVDIMPFSAHLAALNLTMQSPREVTNKTRIGVGNSLNLAAGSSVGNLSQWLQTFGGGVTDVDENSPYRKGDAFELEPVDISIMNPPFTRKERLTSEMKGVRFGSIGNQNFWAYFILLADSLLKNNGTIAAVLPRDIFRGDNSKNVRGFLWSKGRYSLCYVVKSTKDTAFSESARFRDFLVVTKRNSGQEPCAFVYLKKRIKDLSIEDAANIAVGIRAIKKGNDFEDESVRVIWKDQKEIADNWKDLGHLIVFNTASGQRLVQLYNEVITKAGSKLTTLSDFKPTISVLRGLEPSSENLLNLIFIVRPLDKRRTGHSGLIINSEGKETITGTIKKSSITFEVPKSAVKKGLKTAAYVPRIDVRNITDLAIVKSFQGISDLQHYLNVKKVDFKSLSLKAKDRFSHLVVSRRINITAPGTKVIAFYSEQELLPGKAFWSLPTDVATSRALSIWLNSTFSLIELLLSQTETEGSFTEITKESLMGFHVPDFRQIDVKWLEKAFETIAQEEVTSLIEQFTNPQRTRETIDKAVLKIIGFSDEESSTMLRDLYAAMSTELQSWLELMRRSERKASKNDLQMQMPLEED